MLVTILIDTKANKNKTKIKPIRQNQKHKREICGTVEM
jgi:hypothetical protein